MKDWVHGLLRRPYDKRQNIRLQFDNILFLRGYYPRQSHVKLWNLKLVVNGQVTTKVSIQVLCPSSVSLCDSSQESGRPGLTQPFVRSLFGKKQQGKAQVPSHPRGASGKAPSPVAPSPGEVERMAKLEEELTKIQHVRGQGSTRILLLARSVSAV